MVQRKKAARSRVGTGGDQSRKCLVVSVSVQIAVTLAFFAYVFFFPNDDPSSKLYQWWARQDHSSRSGVNMSSAHEAAPVPTTLSHIMFGIGSSARTWGDRRKYVDLWWRDGQTRGHVWLEREPLGGKEGQPATGPPCRVSADACTRFGRRASASRLARIVADSFQVVTAELGNGTTSAAREDEVRWFVMGDDDTVFFPDNLVSVLRKYDHRDMYYIGAPSDSVEQDEVHQYGTAFGGGGFVISYPAAAELSKAIDGCLDRYKALWGGDERVHGCFSELGVPLTREPGFHQMDIRGDAYGMLASHPVAPLVTLHHMDYIQPITPQGRNKADALRPLVDASRFDPARLLQQTICYQRGRGYTWSVSVSWGYTAQVYPWSVPARELEVPLLTFRTWEKKKRADGPFVFNTRPWTPDDACARPAIFFLSDVRNETESGNATVTEYSRQAETKECDQSSFRATTAIRTVRVLAPKMDPSDWEQWAPRRHCCEVGKIVQGSVLEVQIRRCGRGELATAP